MTNIKDFNKLAVSIMTPADKKELFKTTLLGTNREGIQLVLDFLETTDFYQAPSSASYHSNYEGGLLDHSLLVCATALKLRETYCSIYSELAEKFDENSIIISALLHDICKVCFYHQTVKNRKNAQGTWEQYLGYEINDTFPIGHGEKSVIILLSIGLKLTPEEMIAIRFHMGSWDGALMTNDVKYSYQAAMNSCPLMLLLQTADNSSSLLFEETK